MKISYPICIYPAENAYTVTVPDLPGCVTEGETLEEAFEMAIDAASGWVLDELEDGKAAPAPSDMRTVRADEYENGFVSMILIDMDAYAEKYGCGSVRKNCTIPAWLNTAAENAHLNFSQILQNGLLSQLNLS